MGCSFEVPPAAKYDSITLFACDELDGLLLIKLGSEPVADVFRGGLLISLSTTDVFVPRYGGEGAK
jgi:hypothetical protein